MATATRPYIVVDKSNEINPKRLVIAANPAQALRKVASDAFSVEAASSSEVVALMRSGIEPEYCSADTDTTTA